MRKLHLTHNVGISPPPSRGDTLQRTHACLVMLGLRERARRHPISKAVNLPRSHHDQARPDPTWPRLRPDILQLPQFKISA